MTFILRDAIARSPAVAEYRKYYASEQPNALTAAQLTILDGLVTTAKPLVDNQCRVIVDTVRSRLSVGGLICRDAAVQAAVDEDWLLSGLPAQQHSVHRDALRDGEAYLLLAWRNDTGRPWLEAHPQWAGSGGDGSGEGVHLAYDDDGRPQVALKEWVSYPGPGASLRRRTLYYPDRIERYALGTGAGSDGGGLGWRPYRLPDDPSWPVPWVDEDGRPLGIPVVPFVNDVDDARHRRRGVSELAGAILGLQRAHNDNLHSLLAAVRMTGYQMITATGMTKEEAADVKVGPGQLIGAAKDTARIGILPAGDLSQVEKALSATLKILAQNADLPVHAFTGEWPSGEALMRAEIKLVARARVRQERFGRAWASALHKAVLLRNAFGRERLDPDALITVRWDDAAMRDQLFVIQLVNAKQQVLSRRQTLRELGYDEQTIDKIIGELEDDARRGILLQPVPVRGSPPLARDPATGDRVRPGES
jgi:hypothetical protein